MNKLYLAGIIAATLLLLGTYLSVGTSEGGLNGDIVNQLAVLGAVLIILIAVFTVVKYVRQMQTDTADGKLADESWDGIGEYKNELPTGWAVSFFVLMVYASWYMTIGYPVNAYSAIGEYNEDTIAHKEKYATKYQDITGERLVEMGKSVFLAKCKVCHGLTADGLDGKAANLNKRIAKESVLHVIMNGANNFKTGFPGGMPAGLSYMFADDAEINQLADYVVAGLPASDTEGAALFKKGTCNSCHGDNGGGTPFVAPKINGFDIATVVTVLSNGKKGAIGRMPKFTRLNTKQKEAAGAYITSLSK